MAYEKEGAVSEWHEGNLKNLRLHVNQSLSSFAGIDFLSKSLDGKNWNYQIWVRTLFNHLKEGWSKYDTAEYQEIIKIKNIIEDFLDNYPIFEIVIEETKEGLKKKTKVNKNNWNLLRRLVELFEYKISCYHDKHGLSTGNQTTRGLFG